MATTTTIPITAGSGINLDGEQLTVDSTTVVRENVVLSDPAVAAGLASVKSPLVQAVSTDGSLIVQLNPVQPNLAVPLNVAVNPWTDIFNLMYDELRAIRLAVTALACEGGKNKESDFNPDRFSTQGDQQIN